MITFFTALTPFGSSIALLLASLAPAPAASAPAPAVCTLNASTSTISAANGGSQFLALHTEQGFPFFASEPWFFGSMSGTSPGIFFNGVTLPLNVDRYFYHSYLGGPYLQPFQGFDENGDMVAELRFAPGALNRFVGLTLHHGYATINSLTLMPACASNPVPLTVLP